jgi:transcriptional regulator of acetoin/glycerol metabolism
VVPLPETKKPETLKALAATGRQMTKAAQMLGISRMTLYRRMGEYGL